jgi:dipeptidyl aminopeptidase/acylaminoacyl peptidase
MRLTATAGIVILGMGRLLGQTASIEPIRSESLAHPDDPAKRIEIVWTKPAGEGPWPVLLLVHGHQEGDRPGARVYLDGGGLNRFAQFGVLAAAVSQPGYGKSDGPPDFSGPRSQRAVVAAIEHFRKQPQADAKRVALFGYSRGAVVASMVATQVPDLAAVVLGAGIYDLKATYPRLERGIRVNIDREAGKSDDAYRARSAIFLVDRIKAPTLVLHGEDDLFAPVVNATLLAGRIPGARLETIEGAGHLPSLERPDELNRLLLGFLP